MKPFLFLTQHIFRGELLVSGSVAVDDFECFFSYTAYLIFQDILVILYIYTPWKFSSKRP